MERYALKTVIYSRSVVNTGHMSTDKCVSTIATYLNWKFNQKPLDQRSTELILRPEEGNALASHTEVISSPDISTAK